MLRGVPFLLTSSCFGIVSSCSRFGLVALGLAVLSSSSCLIGRVAHGSLRGILAIMVLSYGG